MSVPPVLTPERIDAMLSIMAEVCLDAVVESGQRQKTSPDFDEFERAGRSLQRACRNLRQTIAMKQRHDREQDRKADDGRRRAEAERQDAERQQGRAVTRKRAAVQAHFDRVLWDEHEQDDAIELCDDVRDRLEELAEYPDFLDTPIETLIQRLADDIGLGDPPQAPEPPPPRPKGRGDRPKAAKPTKASTPPQALSDRRDRGDRAEVAETPAPSASSAVQDDGSAVTPLEALAPPDPQPRPPDPPQPYIPPWEQLRPGQIMPGGSGW